MRELQGMFPSIPRAYIVRELDRADGAVSVAIDNLLLLAADFMNSNESNTSLSTPAANANSNTHHNILRSLEKSKGEVEGVKSTVDPSITVTKKNWDTIDSSTRQRILNEKKREMLIKARESFLKK